jgi:hypothetical protein
MEDFEWMEEVEEAKLSGEYIEYPTNDSSYKVKTVTYLTPQKHYGWFQIPMSRMRFNNLTTITTTCRFSVS